MLILLPNSSPAYTPPKSVSPVKECVGVKGKPPQNQTIHPPYFKAYAPSDWLTRKPGQAEDPDILNIMHKPDGKRDCHTVTIHILLCLSFHINAMVFH